MTSRTVGALLALIGGAMLAAGIVLAFGHVHHAGIDCGSAFGGVNTAAAETADLERAMLADELGTVDSALSATADACRSAVADRAPIAWAILAPGALIAFAGVVVAVRAGAIGNAKGPAAVAAGPSPSS